MNMCESYSCSQSTSKPIQLESNWKPLDHRCQRKPAYMIMLNFPTVLDSEWLGGWFLFVCFCQLMKTNLVWWSIWSEKQTWGYFPSTQSGQVYACLTLGRNKFLDQCLSKYSLHIPHHWGSWKAATMHQVDILLNRDWHLKKNCFVLGVIRSKSLFLATKLVPSCGASPNLDLCGWCILMHINQPQTLSRLKTNNNNLILLTKR